MICRNAECILCIANVNVQTCLGNCDILSAKKEKVIYKKRHYMHQHLATLLAEKKDICIFLNTLRALPWLGKIYIQINVYTRLNIGHTQLDLIAL